VVLVLLCLQSKLRIGLAEQSVLVALAAAVQLHSEGIGVKDAAGSSSSKGKGKVDATALAERIEAAAQIVKSCYSECPSYDVVSPFLLVELKMGAWQVPMEFCNAS
jgi:DNA ligase-1